MQVGAPPDWVQPCEYDAEFKPKSSGPLSYLLIERQLHAESSQTFVRTAMRLETAQAVQHQSQWRLELEPQTQSLTLHSVKIRRSGVETGHGLIERLQFLQRESGLEGCVVDGWVTLLLLLEDVRVGDQLEWSYTLTTKPRLLPEYVNSFFTLPAGVEVGKCHFSVRHSERRSLRWKSSSPELAPATQLEGGEVCSSWTAQRMSSAEPEQGLPCWQMPFPWIQVSDCPDWQTIARAVRAAWREEPAGEGMASLVNEIKSFSPELPAQVNRALELVQDGFRYLSVNLELGGQIPASAETVIRRRYGDCKDLAFLLVRLFHALGVPARPVLVNAISRRAVGGLLPSPGIFNHVIVEFELGDEKRWVDPTLKFQGGGALKRCLPDFGMGLPLDDATTELVPVPKGSIPTAAWEIKESIVLDTAGHSSQVMITVRARGLHADQLRWEFANQGVDRMAKKGLQNCANRFSRATRIGQLHYRDEREQNEFVVSEAFEVQGFLGQDSATRRCIFNLHSDVTAGALTLPSGPTVRREPLALPFPCSRVHTLEIDFSAMRGLSLPQSQVGNEFFTFTRRSKMLPNFLGITFNLDVLTDCVPPERVPAHRKAVESAWQAATIRLLLPPGYSRRRAQMDPSQLDSAAHSPASAAQSNLPTEPQTSEGKGSSWLREKLDERRRTQPPALGLAAAGAGQAAGTKRNPAARRGQGTGGKGSGRNPGQVARLNKKCVLSLCLLLAAIAALGMGVVLSRTPSGRGIASLLLLFTIAALPGSLVLAVMGIRECKRAPHKYTSGKEVAIPVIVVGGLFCLLFILGVVVGVHGVLAGTGYRRDLAASGKALRFEVYRFIFHFPPRPWVQTDARGFGKDAAFAFARPGPIGFVALVHLAAESPEEATSRMVEASKNGMKRSTTSYHLVTEGEVAHAGLTGFQMETAANWQGHDDYYVHWVLITNGWGYELVTWGPVSLKEQVKNEADRMCSNFELTPRVRP